ncbi:MAG: hypothetical protein WCF57_14990 [Pyrinomonadaceae bacterium]
MKLRVRIPLCVTLAFACATYPLAQTQTQPPPSTPSASQETTNTQEAATTMTTADALTNADVLEMLRAGLAPEIITAKIKASASRFDTSPDTLQELKKAGVPDAIVLAMVEASNVNVASPDASIALETVDVRIPDGTQVEVELNETISSDNLKEGALIDFKVVQPILVDGVTVIEKGAGAKARITRAKKAGYWGRSGKLEWAMQDVAAADGSRIPLRFTSGQKGSGSTGKVATGVAVTAILFFPAAPLWGFKKGKNAVIPAGQRYEVAVHGDSNVKGKRSASKL